MDKRIKNSANHICEHAEKPTQKLKTKDAGERTHAAVPKMSGLKSDVVTCESTASDSDSAISAGTLPPLLFSQYHIFCCLTPDFRAKADCDPAMDIALSNAFINTIITKEFVFVNKPFCRDLYKVFCNNV